MNRMIRILRDYDGIDIVGLPPAEFSVTFREYSDCIFTGSTRHGDNTPWAEVPWMARGLRNPTRGPVLGTTFHVISSDTWWDISRAYEAGKLTSPCPLLFVGMHQMYAIDAEVPKWPEAVSQIMMRSSP